MANVNNGNGNGKNTGKTPTTTPAKGEAAKTETPASGATATATATDAKPEKAKKAKKERIRLVSKNVPGLWARMFRDVYDRAVAADKAAGGNGGVLYDAKGEALIVKAGKPGGERVAGVEGSSKKAAKKAAKEAEAKLLEDMTDEQKLEHARKMREERAAAKLAKEETARQALIAQVVADIEAGKIKLPTKSA